MVIWKTQKSGSRNGLAGKSKTKEFKQLKYLLFPPIYHISVVLVANRTGKEYVALLLILVNWQKPSHQRIYICEFFNLSHEYIGINNLIEFFLIIFHGLAMLVMVQVLAS